MQGTTTLLSLTL